MTRALRCDKMTLAALEATLELYESPETAMQAIPTLARLSEPIESLRRRATELAARLAQAIPNEAFEVTTEESFAGGGSLPAWPLPTAVIRWKPAGNRSVAVIAEKLRLCDPAVLVRVQNDAIQLDMRTIAESDGRDLATAIANCLNRN
jgi:L-seryl-tRNA(Ser) seleniumtransferase